MNETFIRIISLILGTAFLVLSFRLSRKKEHSLAPAVIIIAAIFFFGGLFHAGGLLKTTTLEQFACWIVAGAFLVAAFRFLQTEKISLAFTVFILSALFFFCSLSGVQSLLKTGMLWTVSERLTKYGEKIDSFQLAMADMRNQLSDQQGQILTNQNKIELAQLAIANQQTSVNAQQIAIGEQEASVTNQYQKIFTLQSQLAVAQTNLSSQAAKIQGVEFLVENLFSKMVFENIPASDTNRIAFVSVTNDRAQVLIKLQHTPISGSLQIFVTSEDSLNSLQRVRVAPTTYKNILFQDLYKYDATRTAFSIQYVRDTRVTDVFQTIEVKGRQCFLDGVLFWDALSPDSYIAIPVRLRSQFKQN